MKKVPTTGMRRSFTFATPVCTEEWLAGQIIKGFRFILHWLVRVCFTWPFALANLHFTSMVSILDTPGHDLKEAFILQHTKIQWNSSLRGGLRLDLSAGKSN